MLTSTVKGTDLGGQILRNTLFLRYCVYPPYTPPHCDGCNAAFSICHVLDCNKGGLITTGHIKLPDEVSDLAGKAFTHYCVRYYHLIHPCFYVQEGKEKPKGSLPKNPCDEKDMSKQKLDLLIHEIWKRGTDSIHEMHVVNTDYLYHQKKLQEKFLLTAEK